jgi:N-acetylmuramoyl-L-alanine amidase
MLILAMRWGSKSPAAPVAVITSLSFKGEVPPHTRVASGQQANKPARKSILRFVLCSPLVGSLVCLTGGPLLALSVPSAANPTPPSGVVTSTQPVSDREALASLVTPLAGKVIVLDPGHAVKNDSDKIINPGSYGRGGVEERDVVLEVAEKLVPLLEAQGAKVYLTRTKSNVWRYSLKGRRADNRSRAIFANSLRANAYVRLHCDWNRNKKFKGFTTYYFRWGSRRLAACLDRSMAEALPGHIDRGLHRRTFVSVTTTMPTVLLEMGVLSNRKEGKDLGSDNYQNRLAQAISNGLVRYFARLPS